MVEQLWWFIIVDVGDANGDGGASRAGPRRVVRLAVEPWSCGTADGSRCCQQFVEMVKKDSNGDLTMDRSGGLTMAWWHSSWFSNGSR
ncbi:hypothetical protein F0562_014538, partial [Nyssa sinensis]